MSDKKQSIKEFSERLKHIITALGTSGREFAARAGIGYSTLHNYLHAVSSPTLDNLVLLAKAGNVSVEWLATGQQSHKNSDSAVIAVPFIDRSSDVLKLDAQLLAKKELRSLYAIRISTDVMHPTFLPGAVLLIDINDTKLTDNKLVVMLQNGNYLFKRVQVLLDGICLLNDNNLYPSITVPNDEINNINVVGTVIMIINCVN
ncbi:helix-turn-helix domain-containing protein [Cronobacter turicensis]|uniref:Helix-turn-helix domain-containing protein n=2 Tax=Cronobacter turicensis TaxID=413502 RepID=A0A2T7BA49_9ENTR|nr:LexA family transcriptional regulator [Cronobacter turicensis]PUX26511.1 helix-turn-helix domain-containing protein [Cronobacter turicensis]PUX37497.1 helix-turn-helix domain-containing protein [Cronobacter turicensis]